MSKILLLGGNGYIGCRLYEYIKQQGYDVTNVDLCWFGKIYEETIVSDYDSLSKEFLNQYSHIILLAAHSAVAMCEKTLIPCFENNVTKFVKLIEKLNPNQSLIYSSSAAVYGSSDLIMDETKPLTDPINFYDFTKFCNENIIKLYPSNNIVGLRFGSVGGFSKNFRYENLMNSISSSAFKNNKITISNPNKFRSILGIMDLCKAITAILDQGIKSKIYNITSLNDTILNFGKTIQQINGCDLEINDTFHTSYSFICSNSKFEHDYSFMFRDNVESIYNDIVSQYNDIVVSEKRG